MSTIYACLPHPEWRDGWYHRKRFLDFIVDLHRAIQPGDDLRVLTPSAIQLEAGRLLPPEVLIPWEVEDVWIRDFAPVRLPVGYRWFRFGPQPDEAGDAPSIRRSIAGFPESLNLAVRRSNLVMDGGSFAWNGRDKAVVSERVLRDNRDRSETRIRSLFRRYGIRSLAVIPEEGGGDRTGHVDGMVAWLDESTLAVSDLPRRGLAALKRNLKEKFPELDPVILPYAPRGKPSADGFPSAAGIYANLLMTESAVYLPQYGAPEDARAMSVLRGTVGKPLIPVDCTRAALHGGSLRCLTWDLPCKPTCHHRLDCTP